MPKPKQVTVAAKGQIKKSELLYAASERFAA